MKRALVAALGIVAASLLVGGGYWMGSRHHAGPRTEIALAATGVSPVGTPSARPVTPPHKAEQAAEPPRSFGLDRLVIDTKGDNPEACLRFSAPLAPQAEAHYGDYLKFDPALSPALHTVDKDLCIGGLGYGRNYKLVLLKGLPSASGERLAEDTDVDVSLADRAPLVAISGDGYILPRGTSNGIAVQTINVEKVRIHVLRMSDRLLPSQLTPTQGESGTNPMHNQNFLSYTVRELMRSSASVIWTGTMAVAQDHNRTVQTAFPLDQVIPAGQHGAYLIVAENAAAAMPENFFRPPQDDGSADENDTYQPIAAHWVISTDIALTTMSGQDGLHVFVRSLASADPLPGVRLSLFAAGQDLLGEATSGADGRVDFAPGLLRGKGANQPSSLVAYGDSGDFAALDLTRPAFDFSDRGVTGRPAPRPIEAFLYADRGIYRPGETVNLMTLLRDREGAAVEGTPVTLVLKRPDGIESKRYVLDKLPEGGGFQPVSLAAGAARGLWTLDALVDPEGAPVGHLEIDVQDFVPQQLKVTATAGATFLKPGDPIDVSVEARYLYGAPATGLNAEAEVKLTADSSPVADAKGYQFGLAEKVTADTVQQLDLPPPDATGHTRIAASLDPPQEVTGPLKAVIRTGVFEPSGRIVNDTIELPVRLAPLLIGIKPRFADGQVDEDSQAIFDIRLFDDTGKPVAGSGLHWRLIRENKVYDWFSEGNGWTWHFHVVDEPVGGGTVDVVENAPSALSQSVGWGNYRLEVEDPATGVASSVRFNAGWGGATDTADTPDKVEVTTDKPVIAAGDTAHIRIKGPFAGEAQVTVAGDRIFETRNVTVPKDGATVEIAASKSWGPGAYVLVSMYRPLMQGRAHDPVRAVGLAWLAIDARSRTLPVTLTIPDKVTPRQTIAIPVKIANGSGTAFVTVAAVDEGILQLTRFATPDPVDFLFGKRQLGIDMRDDYGRLLDGSAEAGDIHEGGDEGIGGPGLPVTTTKTVALFSGPVELDSRGEARISLDIPDFEGQLRLMAVAYDHDAVGKGEGNLIVRDPVIADLALPRFLAPGDGARAAVNLHNTDGVAGQYHLAFTASGSVKLGSGAHPTDYTLAEGAQQFGGIDLVGVDEGIGKIAADLSGPGGYKVHREWQIAVRSAHYPVVLEQTASQASGQSFNLDATVLAPFVPGSATVSLGYSAYAGIDVPSLLQSLYRYPFGCTEQLASTAFPLLYFGDPALLGHTPQDVGVRERVQKAIDSILDRQDLAGEFGLWRVSDGEASPWLNVYAVDFLVHAKDAGFNVPTPALRRSFEWIRLALARLGDGDDGAYAEAPDATRAYALYVLAKAGRADIGELRRIADQIGRNASTGKRTISPVYWRLGKKNDDSLAEPLSLGHLAAALALMGDRPRARATLGFAVDNIGLKTYPLWWFYSAYYSDARDIAGLIAIAAEMGDDKTAADLIGRFKDLAIRTDDLNTQDKAALLAAAHALNTADVTRVIRVNGKPLSDPKLPLELSPDAAAIKAGYAVANGGDRPIWRTLVVSGSPATALPGLERGYSLAKSYFDLAGKPVDVSHLHQNDRVIVSLTGKVLDPNDHRTVLIDLLPAGWEIEGPIVQKPPKADDTDDPEKPKPPAAPVEYGFLMPLSKLRMAETRDDRFVTAFDLGKAASDDTDSHERNDKEAKLDPQEFHVAYVVRVVTPGSFDLPESVVQDMYRPGMMARTAAGHTDVEAH